MTRERKKKTIYYIIESYTTLRCFVMSSFFPHFFSAWLKLSHISAEISENYHQILSWAKNCDKSGKPNRFKEQMNQLHFSKIIVIFVEITWICEADLWSMTILFLTLVLHRKKTLIILACAHLKGHIQSYRRTVSVSRWLIFASFF